MIHEVKALSQSKDPFHTDAASDLEGTSITGPDLVYLIPQRTPGNILPVVRSVEANLPTSLIRASDRRL